MPQRRFERLSNLVLKCKRGIIGHTMIMAIEGSEFGLNEEGASGNAARCQDFQCITNPRLRVMVRLIRGVNGAKSRANRFFDKGSGGVLFPRGPVYEACWIPTALHEFPGIRLRLPSLLHASFQAERSASASQIPRWSSAAARLAL